MEGVKLTVNKGLSNHFQVSLPGALTPLGHPNHPPAPTHATPSLPPKGLGSLAPEKTQRHSARLTAHWVPVEVFRDPEPGDAPPPLTSRQE